MSKSAILLAAVVSVICLNGCGTVSNLSENKTPYGGVVKDLSLGTEISLVRGGG